MKTGKHSSWNGEHRGAPYNFDKDDWDFEVTLKVVSEHEAFHATVTINDI